MSKRDVLIVRLGGNTPSCPVGNGPVACTSEWCLRPKKKVPYYGKGTEIQLYESFGAPVCGTFLGPGEATEVSSSMIIATGGALMLVVRITRDSLIERTNDGAPKCPRTGLIHSIVKKFSGFGAGVDRMSMCMLSTKRKAGLFRAFMEQTFDENGLRYVWTMSTPRLVTDVPTNKPARSGGTRCRDVDRGVIIPFKRITR